MVLGSPEARGIGAVAKGYKIGGGIKNNYRNFKWSLLLLTAGNYCILQGGFKALVKDETQL